MNSEELIEQLNTNNHLYRNPEYEVIEEFSSNRNVYVVHSLKAESEDNIIIFDDIDEVLQNNKYLLSYGLIEKSLIIQKIDNEIIIACNNEIIKIKLV